LKKYFALFLMVLSYLALATGAQSAPFSGGTGESNNPYIITTAAQLDEVRNYRGGSTHFKLGNDISLTSYLSPGGAGFAKWNTLGWLPIGALQGKFYGKFDGNGKKITGLWINRITTEYVGLFGYAEDVTIKNLGVEIASAIKVNGKKYVGGLVGYLYTSSTNCSIENCYTTGNVFANEDYAGGLVGYQYSNGNISITNCYATGDVKADGYCAGGLVGYQSGTNYRTTNCYAKGYITANSTVGGLIGHTDGLITSCYATGNVRAINNYAGGLVGVQRGGSLTNFSNIENCYATGNVMANGINAGGLAGYQYGYGARIRNCYATGNITANDRVGGLVGYQSAYINQRNEIENSYAMGNVTAVGNNARGLVGFQYYDYDGRNHISESYRYVNAAIIAGDKLVIAADSQYGAHGATKTAAELKSKLTYTGNNWLFADSSTAGPWHWDSRGFPKLNIGNEELPFKYTSFSGGEGTSASPYLITTAAQLDEARNYRSSHFMLSFDIDLTGYLSPGGAGYAKWGARRAGSQSEIVDVFSTVVLTATEKK